MQYGAAIDLSPGYTTLGWESNIPTSGEEDKYRRMKRKNTRRMRRAYTRRMRKTNTRRMRRTNIMKMRRTNSEAPGQP